MVIRDAAVPAEWCPKVRLQVLDLLLIQTTVLSEQNTLPWRLGAFQGWRSDITIKGGVQGCLADYMSATTTQRFHSVYSP
jgi:hypothetical protein